MTLSELVEQLQDIHRQHGDLEVFSEDNESRFNPVHGVGIDESGNTATVSLYVD